MSGDNRKKVFVLGAGCSAKFGYPLGIDLASELQRFFLEISDGCTVIKKSVTETISLLKALPAIEPLDQYAKHINDEFLVWESQYGGGHRDHETQERAADQKILDAKIAISAMFVAREEKARGTGLPGYQRLLDSVFGGEPWEEAVADSDCHVLTFNYDRLFVMMFLDHFRSFNPAKSGVYSENVLNTGFTNRLNGGYAKVEPVAGRSCFLKLHGSAGWWVKIPERNSGPDDRLYWPAIPLGKVDLQEIDKMLQKPAATPWNSWQPLIAFPHERESARARNTNFVWDPYLRKIEDHAASVLAGATGVRIIGYSFAPIDSRNVVNNLLTKIPADARIIVQNTPEGIQTVRSRLEAYPALSERVLKVEFDPTPF